MVTQLINYLYKNYETSNCHHELNLSSTAHRKYVDIPQHMEMVMYKLNHTTNREPHNKPHKTQNKSFSFQLYRW